MVTRTSRCPSGTRSCSGRRATPSPPRHRRSTCRRVLARRWRSAGRRTTSTWPWPPPTGRCPPPGTGIIPGSPGDLPCVPLDQAREAVAIWLAILAAHPPASDLQDGLPARAASMSGTDGRQHHRPDLELPRHQRLRHVTRRSGRKHTAAGYLLANAMTRLPAQKVSHVLAGAWGRVAELAHHRRPARHRTRHTDAQRPGLAAPSAREAVGGRTGQARDPGCT